MTSRLLAASFAAALAAAAGCATLKLGERHSNRDASPRMFDACVFVAEPTIKNRNAAQFMMATITGGAGAPGFARSAVFVSDLNDAVECDVALKAASAVTLSHERPLEVYSARTKAHLFTLRGDMMGGSMNLAAQLRHRLRPGAPDHERLLADASPERRAELAGGARPASASVAAAPAAPAPGGVSREELKALMAEAMKAAAQPQAASAPSAPSSDADKPRYRRPEDARNFAVVVGVEKYADLPEARFAERDAQAVYDHLVAMGYPPRNIALLKGPQATRTGLVKNLEAWLPQNAGPDSTVFFYYSGHGAPDPKAGTAYLVPADGDPQYLEETAYPVKRLYEKLSALKARRVLVAMDSCFSGAGGRSVLARGTRPLVGRVELGQAGGKVVSLSASESDQISGSIEEQGHGLFTYYLLKGLNGEAADGAGRVTVKTLHSYLSPKVRDAAKRANREQAPQLFPPSLPDSDDLRLR